jgi:hypothetical protein
MPLTEDELWLLNLYRNSELHGALLMGRIARTVSDPALLAGATEHCATEAKHAAMLTETIFSLGGRIDPLGETIQEHYSALGGVPAEIVDLLVLSEVLERRVLASYGEHLARGDVHPLIRNVLTSIMHEESEHSGDQAWVERALSTISPERVRAAKEKWTSVDKQVAAKLHHVLAEKFAVSRTRT